MEIEQIKVSESTAARRRVYFQIVDATDGITPKLAEIGGQPQHTDPAGIVSFAVSGAAPSGANRTYIVDFTQVYGLRPVYKPATGSYVVWYDVSGWWVMSTDAGTSSGNWWKTATSSLSGTFTKQGTASNDGTIGDATTGPVWTAENIGTLNAIGYGRYYAELTVAAIATVGERIDTRYKSGNTAEIPGSSLRVVTFDPHDRASAWQAASQAALVANHLDHLLAVDTGASLPGVAGAILQDLLQDDGGTWRLAPNALEGLFLVDLDQVEATAPDDSLCCMVLMALHSNTRDNAGKITVYRTDDATEFVQLDYTTDPNAYPIDGVS